jgi:hypothetical protein
MNKLLFLLTIYLGILILSGCGGAPEQSTIPTKFQQLGGGNLIIDGVPHEVATVQPRDRGDVSTPDYVKVKPDSDRSDYLIQIPVYTLVNGQPDLSQPKLLIKFYIMHYMPHMMVQYGYMPSINFNHARRDSWDAQGHPIPNEYGQDIVYPACRRGTTVMLTESTHDEWGHPIYTGYIQDGEFFGSMIDGKFVSDPMHRGPDDPTVTISLQFKTMLFDKHDY